MVNSEFKQAFKNLFSAKLRSFLAVLGILVGTASVVTLLSSGEMATAKVLAQFKHLGTDLMSVSAYPEGNQKNSATVSLSMDDAADIKNNYDGIKDVAAYTITYQPIAYQGHALNGLIIGATRALARVVHIQLASGHFISSFNQYQRYCVIGDKLAKQIKQHTRKKLIGDQIWLGHNIYTIIGVAKSWPENPFFNADINNAVIIPIQSSHLLSKNTSIRDIVIQLYPNTDAQSLLMDVKQYFKQNYPELKVFARSAKEFIKSMKSQYQTLTLLLGLIGGVSLLVGGIGVMNIMLVSVTERRREIGIRKAIGATRRDIQNLFLFEAAVLALFGGGLGVVVGLALSYFVALFAHWPYAIFLLPPAIGFCVSAATGIFFGFYPAYRAARLNPIDALRSE